ncbi:MAG: NAD-dependent malic enzyme, partial [Bryobacteraceae bacterium]
MRLRTIPQLAPLTKPGPGADGWCETKARGLDVLHSPLLNKGTAFSVQERKALGLTGLLPPDISTLAAQANCAYVQYER